MIEGTFGANLLLKALMRDAPGPWQRHLEVVRLSLGEVLNEPYVVSEFVYFPLTAVIALLHVLEDGSSAEIAMVGPEGVVNLSLFMGVDIAPGSAMVQCAGFAVRLRADLLERAIASDPKAARLLMRYSQTLIAQVARTAACNRHHAVHLRLARWILLMLDRRAGDAMPMTQDLIAVMLGMPDASANAAVAALQDEGLVMFSRGRITVLNRPALEARVCGCYASIRSEHDRLLPALDEITATQRAHDLRTDASRLAFLHQSAILDTAAGPVLEKITSKAGEVFAAPMAMISILDRDRDWLKARIGYTATETPAASSLCSVFFETDQDTIVVPSTLEDPRFAGNASVRGAPFVRFYAAVRLAIDGHTIGTLCVCDTRQRQIERSQVQALQALGAEAVRVLSTAMQ